MPHQEKEDRRRVLEGYKQKGKRFIPPWLQHFPMEGSSWIDDRIPELVWIALLMHTLGVKRGNDIAVAIARAATKSSKTNKAFAMLSDYVELSDEQKHQTRTTLDGKGILGIARTALSALIYRYDGFPLAFLAGSSCDGNNIQETTLGDLRDAIDAILDRNGRPAMFAQATAVNIYFTNGQLKVASGVSLGNLSAIEEYPETEESLRVASTVRAALTALISFGVSPGWPDSFWRQGRILTPCEVVDHGNS